MAGVRLARAAAEVARAGNTEHIEQATKLLDEATHELTAIVSHN